MSLLQNELDLIPRAFDLSVFSVPFTLPSERLVAASPSLVVYPEHSLVGQTLSGPRAWFSVANETRRLNAEPADANSDMGIAGGLGSGSSLGSRARALPTAKYHDSSTAAPEAGTSALFRGVSSESAIRSTAPMSADDIADIVRDLAILDQLPGWELDLLTGLPGLQPGLDIGSSKAPISEGWLLDCPFSHMMAGIGGSFALGGPGVEHEIDAHVVAQGARASAISVFDAVAKLDELSRFDDGHQGGSNSPVTGKNSSRKVPGRNISAGVHVVKTAAGLFDDSDSEGDAGDLEELEDILFASQQLAVPAPAPAASVVGFGAVPLQTSTKTVVAAEVPPTVSLSRERPLALPVAMFPSLPHFDLGEAVPSADDGALLRSLLAQSAGVASSAPVLGIGLPLAGATASSATMSTGLRWAVSKRMTPDELVRAEARFTPAKTWPFQLDIFQREAIARIETQGSSTALFVAAHTSAGKTVVAEYAIALSVAHRTRCIYTSPIKALSNQKYHDLRKEYGGADGERVGIITGDVTVNPDASCLVMTTEILRSMLYRGDEIISDIEFVVFDEVHYINDEERGVVYEETLMLLPDHIGLIFLSATSPNREEFAEWVGRTKSKPVYILETSKRPVPLNHFLFADNSLTLLMEGALIDKGENTGWRVPQYKAIAEKLKARLLKRGGGAAYGPSLAISAGRAGGGTTPNDRQAWLALVKVLKSKDLLPCIVFSFSKKKCEDCAFLGLASVDLTAAREKAAIHIFFSNAVQRLSGTDRTLPQILRLQGLLKRGIGVHHAGLLPIMKECVEMLFARGLIKILFATETFAMGVNMPARAVLFNGIRKHDGKENRDLTPGEYTQMAGRAGRRGLDVNGTVIILSWGDALPDLTRLQFMMTGRPTRLSSKFRLTYNMILNILRTEDISVTSMMARSYAEFAAQSALGGRNATRLLAQGTKRLAQLRAQLDDLPCILRSDGVVDREVLDIEEAGGPRELLFRNEPGVEGAHAALQQALQSHMVYVRKLLGGGRGAGAKAADQVLAAGRIIVLSEVNVPVAAESAVVYSPSNLADKSAPAAEYVTCFHVPAVVLEVQSRPRSSACSAASSAGAVEDRMEAWLTVAVLLPACVTAENMSSRADVLAADSFAFLAPLTTKDRGFEGMVNVGKRAGSAANDDLAGLTGGLGKAKNKGGRGGGAMSHGTPVAADAAQGATEYVAPSMADLLLASGTPGILLAQERDVAVGHLQRMPLGGAALRMVGILQVRGKTIARVTRLIIGNANANVTNNATKGQRGGKQDGAMKTVASYPTDSISLVKVILAGMTSGDGGASALHVLASQLLQQLSINGADVAARSGSHGHDLARLVATSAPMNDLGSTLGSLITRLPSLHPRDDMRPPVSDLDVADAYAVSTQLEDALHRSKCSGCSRWPHQWQLYSRVQQLETALAAVRRKFSIEALTLYPEMRSRLGLMRDLGYTQLGDASPVDTTAGSSNALATLDVVKLKGRVAAEVNTCDELIFTEMVFSGVLSPLSPAECAALLSALVFQERGGSSRDMTPAQMAVGDGQSVWQTADVGESGSRVYSAERNKRDDDSDDEEASTSAPFVDTALCGADDIDAALLSINSLTDDSVSVVSSVAGGISVTTSIDDTAFLREEVLPVQPATDTSLEAEHAVYTGPRICAIPQILVTACDRLNAIAFALGRLQMDAGLDIIPAEYMREKLNYGLLLPTYAWAVGVPFAEICQLTECAEGTIVRTITRLDETCREVRNAARIIGDPVLFRKMEVASACIKRDVIFAGSLYIS